MKKLAIGILAVIVLFTGTMAAETRTKRMWENLNITTLLSPDLSFTVMPGHRWEFGRNSGSTVDTYFMELFVGPNYALKINDSFKLKLSLWYYYMYFPNRFTETAPFSHNIEVIPTIEWKTSDRLTIANRIISHNTIYSSCYTTDDLRSGFSSMIREMLSITYKLPEIDQNLSLILSDELFIGILEDAEAAPSALGFYRNGINSNRLYAGFSYAFSPTFIVVPQVIYETNYDAAGTLTGTNFNFYLTVTYLFKAF
ncbi:MAG: hypothetical protein A2452_05315 [Candidatus Firestonebacteria bacterium RIFOXYC2_FULL_39_67]|nr:MAG: hypothetical protein A2536_10145 [Candidatus Firestonebacteria bacterium RIFOXYD2_FULL_39_29]OGF54027.1 MAG: hypothetical protein A2497_08785 [Candidatus Firestonebacteria bacterium RifOxyC12_full_39_7]OGF56360.1 MAG: hypothetical protein A2452_05315 [Candidatus Firestonebacteria bacterium RIFOXYC2_FULL_39_67]